MEKTKELREYLEREWRYNVHKKYHKYFDLWYDNLTDTQVLFYSAWMRGSLSPFAIREN